MKTKSIWMLAAALTAAVMAMSCRPKDPIEPAGNKLEVKPSSAISFEAAGNNAVTLTVTTDAANWEYTVPNWITAVKGDKTLDITAGDNEGDERAGTVEFTAGTAAAVNIAVSQKAGGGGGEEPESLQGSAYFVLLMDPVSYGKIEDKVMIDLRANEEALFMDVWEGTYIGVPPVGMNSYGETGDDILWFSVKVVGGPGWSGGGLRTTETVSIEVDGDWYFHFAVKSNGEPHGFKIWGGGALGETTNAYTLGIGGEYNDNGTIYKDLFPGIRMNGDWKEYKISVKDMIEAGWLTWDDSNSEKYLFSFISGGTADRTFELDAVFFYKE